jgi:SAM-dependent methyltransferase
VWDLGCNDGTYARVAAEHAGYVVAVDADHPTVDGLYRSLGGRTDILPLVMSVTDPSPDLGWRGRERASLERRGRPDLVLALALVHHVAITGNVPVAEFLDWLRSLDCALVIEFPDRDDPMVQRLLSGKAEAANPDYDRATFERALGERFAIERTERLGTRTLYEAHP